TENGRKLLQDLATTVRERVSPTGEPLVNREAIKMVERLARDLTAPGGMPGLKLWRDNPTRFVWDQEQSHFRRMEGEGELYEDMVAALVEYLYPEGRKET